MKNSILITINTWLKPNKYPYQFKRVVKKYGLNLDFNMKIRIWNLKYFGCNNCIQECTKTQLGIQLHEMVEFVAGKKILAIGWYDTEWWKKIRTLNPL